MTLYSSLSTVKSRITLLLTVILLIVSFAGMVHSARAAAAHIIYYKTRYCNEQRSAMDPGYASMQCQLASALYPYNYYFHMWTAENSHYRRVGEDGTEVCSRLEDAEKWCDAGLANNKWKRQLRILKARLMAESSPSEAAEYLEDYVDWDFWTPLGHAVLVEFYARAGMLDKAKSELLWVKGSRYYADASGQIEAAERQADISPAMDGAKDH